MCQHVAISSACVAALHTVYAPIIPSAAACAGAGACSVRHHCRCACCARRPADLPARLCRQRSHQCGSAGALGCGAACSRQPLRCARHAADLGAGRLARLEEPATLERPRLGNPPFRLLEPSAPSLQLQPRVELNQPFGSFLTGADQFDAAALGVSPAEALLMDPQQRLAMQSFSGAAACSGDWVVVKA